jgi:hypothetical protein
VASPPSLHGTPSAAGAVCGNTVRRPSGQPLGVVAQDIRSWPCLVSLSGPQQHPASSVRCERPVSTRAVSTRPVSSVRCGRPGVRVSAVRCGRPVSGVRCPVGRPGIWASGVRYPGVPASAVSEPGEFVKRADAASSHTARTAGVGVVAPHGIHDRLVVCPSRSLTLEAGAGRAGPNGGVGLAVVVGRSRPAARLDRLADQEEPVTQGPLVGRQPDTWPGSPTCGMAARGSSGTCSPA